MGFVFISIDMHLAARPIVLTISSLPMPPVSVVNRESNPTIGSLDWILRAKFLTAPPKPPLQKMNSWQEEFAHCIWMPWSFLDGCRWQQMQYNFCPNPKAVISSLSIDEMRKAARILPIRTCLYLTQSIQSAVAYGSSSFSGDAGFAGIAWTLCDVVQKILNKDIIIEEYTIPHGISCDRYKFLNQLFGSNKTALVDMINIFNRMCGHFS